MGFFNNLTISDLDVNFVKEYLRIDSTYVEDDELLTICIKSSESYIKNYLKIDTLDDLEQETDIIIACLSLTQHFYISKITNSDSPIDKSLVKSLRDKYIYY